VTIDDLRLAAVPGDGVLARWPGVVFFAPDVTDAKVGELLDLCRNVVESGPQPGRTLARRFAALLGASDEEYPAFCAMGSTETGAAVTLHGAVDVRCVSDGQEIALSGQDSPTWVDRLLPDGLSEAHAGPTGAVPPAAAPLLDLDAGTVPARGFVLGPEPRLHSPAGADATRAPSPQPAPAASDPPSPAPVVVPAAPATREHSSAREHIDFESVVLVDAAPEAPREPLPLGEPAAPEPAASQDLVDGVTCSRGHFNDPDNLFCGVCGISLVQQTQNLTQGPRPPLGFVVFEDSSTYSLDSDYVIGRDPSEDPRVRSGAARPLVLHDEDQRTVSRVHAELRLDGWHVLLVDRGSTNGTFIWDEQAGSWTLLAPDQATRLKPGARAGIGRRSFLFESPFEHRDQ
jgi:hypothetical protein